MYQLESSEGGVAPLERHRGLPTVVLPAVHAGSLCLPCPRLRCTARAAFDGYAPLCTVALRLYTKDGAVPSTRARDGRQQGWGRSRDAKVGD
jgi:hypothetical protein